jgi:hypothetical protein
MDRRAFLMQAAASLALTAPASSQVDLKDCVVVLPDGATAREKKAAAVLIEEAQRRSGVRWRVERLASAKSAGVTIYAATRASIRALPAGVRNRTAGRLSSLAAEGFLIETSVQDPETWIAIVGADERGLLFGVGKLLRTIRFGRQNATVPMRALRIATAPKYPLRGHQLGYRPKTNAYDAWGIATWDQYIRDLAMFGTNAIELIPPRSDDLPDSPHFPVPPEQMMIEMSRICDEYGLDVWIWYPAMDADYADAATVEAALKEWTHFYEIVPRIDAIFVPGGDPGHTEPKAMFAFLEKQKANLSRAHPKAQMWMSPQGFREEWMDQFFSLASDKHAATWLDGVVFGPQSRISLAELRRRLPTQFPIRFYPDITHSVSCQYPVPEWDVAFALTEGRECINPRPEDQANILRRFSPGTIGFLTYSEGCNDDVNKFVWSALGWDPDSPAIDVLRDYSRYFIGHRDAEGFAQGLMDLERNWRGPLATNEGVTVTLARFQDMERQATPALLENWRFQQALYRVYFDAAVRARLLDEEARLVRARDVLTRVYEIGWTPEPLDIGQPATVAPNGRDPALLLEEASRILAQGELDPAGNRLRTRGRELGEALLQSIQMQLAVDRYQGEAVVRGANLETLDTPVTDIAWFRAQVDAIRKIGAANEKVKAIKQLLARKDPGPGGHYDELGNPSNRPHLVTGSGHIEDPEFRASALTGFSYPDRLGSQAPIAWKRWAESLFDAPLKMHYRDLDREAEYRVRVIYSGDGRKIKIKMMAGEKHEVHPLMLRPWPPQPLEFDIPKEATANGSLELTWRREPGLGGNGRGCQVSEVWLMRKDASNG